MRDAHLSNTFTSALHLGQFGGRYLGNLEGTQIAIMPLDVSVRDANNLLYPQFRDTIHLRLEHTARWSTQRGTDEGVQNSQTRDSVDRPVRVRRVCCAAVLLSWIHALSTSVGLANQPPATRHPGLDGVAVKRPPAGTQEAQPCRPPPCGAEVR